MWYKLLFVGCFLIALGTWLVDCGSDTAGKPGDFCRKDSDCAGGLICEDNICKEKPIEECIPKCQEGQVCFKGTCKIYIDPNDRDGDGYQFDQECNDLDPNIHPGALESCDGIDNDCDNVIDEDCPPCAEGVVRDCGTDIGECALGVQSCLGGRWEPCSGANPQAESCDTKDNDCDGLTDEICPCSNGDQFPCGANRGVCSEGTQNCSNGAWTGCTGQPPQSEICDGLDNDCDGVTDDGMESDPARNSCDQAKDLGEVLDNGSEITVSGNMWPEADEDWYLVKGVDDTDEDKEDACDRFHLRVNFLENPGDKLRLDVYVGGCSEAQRLCQGDTVYEHRYDGKFSDSPPVGQCPCSAVIVENMCQCSKEDQNFYIRVYGASGSEFFCHSYRLSISNGKP